MKQPWVYMCSPSRSPLPLPSPPDPSRSSQCTRSERLSHASNLGNTKHLKGSENHSVLTDSLRPHRLYRPWISPGQNTGVGSLSLLQGIFPTQGLNPGLPHCRRILYQLSYKGNPRILEWVAYPFSNRSSQPRNGTRVS